MSRLSARPVACPCTPDSRQGLVFRAGVSATTLTYKDSGLTSRINYCYVVTAWNDCNGNGVFDAGVDKESAPSNQACATAG